MATETPQQQPAAARHERQEVTGVVTSAKMEKTIIVKVTRLVQHKLYHARHPGLQEVLRA